MLGGLPHRGRFWFWPAVRPSAAALRAEVRCTPTVPPSPGGRGVPTCQPALQEDTMPAYITLVNFTDQGIRTVKDTVKRAQTTQAAVQAAGGRLIGVWWTLGPYDVVFVSEAPDEETALQQLLTLGMQGNARTTTLRAFSADEMARIVQGL